MRIRCGYEITYECPAPTPMLLMLNVRPERLSDLETPDIIHTNPPIPLTQYRDQFGNLCSRILAPAGRLTLSADFVIRDSGLPDPIFPDAQQSPVNELPDDVIVFLLGSRYVETQELAHEERQGVCRDYAHLAIALCRCMNIPARYCTGYMGDIGIPVEGVMDFSAWMEVYLGGAWRTLDARHNKPRIGRVMMAMGRDATDVAIITNFGPANLVNFTVIAEELV